MILGILKEKTRLNAKLWTNLEHNNAYSLANHEHNNAIYE